MEKFLSAVLFALICIISPFAMAQASHAGVVIVTSGPFQATNASNQTRTLQRGNLFYSGETLSTGVKSTAQVKFSDGTIVALYPDSRFKVNEYTYTQDPKKDKSVVTLAKGGFRAITGAISKENSSAYQAQTPVAVIGVRGTTYGAAIDKGHLYSGVWNGGIYVKNTKGSIDLGEGGKFNFAEVPSKDSAPIGLLQPPAQLVGQCGKGAADELKLLCGNT